MSTSRATSPRVSQLNDSITGQNTYMHTSRHERPEVHASTGIGGSTLRIITITTNYPSEDDPTAGLFIHRRLEAVSRCANVRVVHLRPWFPLLRRAVRQTDTTYREKASVVTRQRMFYIPGVLKRLDGFWAGRAAAKALASFDGGVPDLLEAQFGYPEGVGTTLLGRKINCPVFITMRGLERPLLATSHIGPQLRHALHQAQGVVCVSHSLERLAIEQGVPPDRVTVIPNAVDRTVFRSYSRSLAREALGIAAECRLIVSVGMLIAGKGHHHLVAAMPAILRKYPTAQLAIVGPTTFERRYPSFLRREVARNGVGRHVKVLGPLPPAEVAKWLVAADLFALATYDEGCCNAILEAMACGTPVVTTDVGDNRFLVDPPNRGFIVPTNQQPQLERALVEALDHCWERPRIASFRRSYTWDTVARKTITFYETKLSYEHRTCAALPD